MVSVSLPLLKINSIGKLFMTIKKHPWTNTRGKLLTKSQLRKVSKKWTTKTWEAYLNAIEPLPRMREELIADSDLPKVNLQLLHSKLPELFRVSPYANLERKFQSLIKNLDLEDRRILKDVFYDQLTLSEISELRNKSKSAVEWQLKTALKKLRNRLLQFI